MCEVFLEEFVNLFRFFLHIRNSKVVAGDLFEKARF